MSDKTRGKESITEEDLYRDTETLYAMGRIYCYSKHSGRAHTDNEICEECDSLIAYSIERTKKCPHAHKGNCQDCDIHCYQPEKRQAIKDMMKYAAPHMMYTHPIMAIRYLRKKLRNR